MFGLFNKNKTPSDRIRNADKSTQRLRDKRSKLNPYTDDKKIKRYITRESLCEMMSSSDFDICSIGKEKTALFIISGKNTFSNSFVPLLISQIFNSIDMYGDRNVINNILLDEFEYLLARLLYPTFIFDIIEDIATDSSSYDYSSQIYFAISKQNKQIDKIKEFYNNIIKIMNIRPIEWINQI